MAVEQRWYYDRIASQGEADGTTCIFCKQRISGESQPAHWVLKAVEDNQDTDFAVADGYAHRKCSQERQASERKSPLDLPEVPQGPGRH